MGNLLEHFTVMFTSFTYQSAVCSLQSAFVANRYLSSLRKQSRLGEMRGGCIHFIKHIDTRIHYVRVCCLRRIN